MNEPIGEPQLDELRKLRDAVIGELSTVIVGQEEILDGLFIAILAGGHALLEGVPGTAKTLMVRSFGRVLGLAFGRIQFTPDLMPSDVVGTSVFDLSSNHFRLAKGPIFTELLLADEINRAPAKTQSALLEAMQERQVTIDGEPHPLGDAFAVFATQNPVEQEGTYPLPEAQLDRFLLKLNVDYPTPEEEDAILDRASQFSFGQHPEDQLRQILPPSSLAHYRALGQHVRIDAAVRQYLRDLVRRTRGNPMILLGAGPRAAIHLLVVARWFAALAGRSFVTPDDVQRALFPVLGHRLVLAPEVELDGLSSLEVLDRIAHEVDVPR